LNIPEYEKKKINSFGRLDTKTLSSRDEVRKTVCQHFEIKQ
jgi:hypothetical protein